MIIYYDKLLNNDNLLFSNRTEMNRFWLLLFIVKFYSRINGFILNVYLKYANKKVKVYQVVSREFPFVVTFSEADQGRPKKLPFIATNK